MDAIDIDLTIALLARTPAALDGLLRGLPEWWTRRAEGEGTWDAAHIVAHLVFGEITDWMPRLRIILAHGEAQPFEPFDMNGHEETARGKSADELLDELATLRAANLRELAALALTPEQLASRGRHPELGSVTVSQLLAAWVAHDLTHLHQLTRVLAHQYREATGPWAAYMGVLQCSGHSKK